MTAFAGSTELKRRDRLEDLPPSAKLVFKVLETESELTQAEIARRSRLSKRTTRHALAKLREADLVRQRVYVPDARKRLYSALEVE